MSIDRGIRACQMKPYPQGALISVPDSDVSEEGILSTAHRKGNIQVTFAGAKDFPASVILRTKIVPVPLKDTSSRVQLIINNKAMRAVPYYGVDAVRGGNDEAIAKFSCNRAIELHFTGYGLFDDKPFQGEELQEIKLILPPDRAVLRKEFQVQTDPLLIQQLSFSPQDVCMVTPPHGKTRSESTPVLGYGGYCKAGISIEKIVMIFSVILSSDQTTYLKLYSLIALKKENIIPPHGGVKSNSRWFFEDDLTKDQCNSLADSIQQGLAKITLQHKSSKELLTYTSKTYQQLELESGEVDITFMPQLNQGRT